MGCEPQVLGEKVNFFNSLGIIEISGIYKLSIYIDIALLKIFTEFKLSMVLYGVMKFCNLGDQGQFEISNLNGHWINTNNAPLLGFSVPNNGDSRHFRFPHGLLINMSLLVL